MYDALQMSKELRESLINAISNPQDYQDDIGPLDRLACLATIYFTHEKKYANVDGHKWKIYISGFSRISWYLE